MKKILKIMLVCLLSISAFIPVFADETDTPEKPIDIDEYVDTNCSGTNSGYVYLSDGSIFSITVSFSGYYRKQYNNSPAPYQYFINATRTGYQTISGTGVPYISTTNYYINNGEVWCKLKITNNIGYGYVSMKVCNYV